MENGKWKINKPQRRGDAEIFKVKKIKIFDFTLRLRVSAVYFTSYLSIKNGVENFSTPFTNYK